MKEFLKTWLLIGEGARSWEYESFKDPALAASILRYSQGSDTKRTLMGHLTHLTMFSPIHAVFLLWAPWWALVVLMLAFGIWRDWNNLSFPPKRGLGLDAYWDIATKCGSVGVGWLVFYLLSRFIC